VCLEDLCLEGQHQAEEPAAGMLWSYRALEGKLRRVRVRHRAGCELCAGDIEDIRWSRYAAAECAA
jgi:hypothetical protein